MAIRRADLQPIITSANFTRPADATAYASGDLVANNTTASSVVPLTFSFPADTTPGNQTAAADKSILRIERVMVSKSTTSTTNATFRVHLFSTNPLSSSPVGITNGDNGAFSVNKAGYIGYVDVSAMIAMKDGAVGFAWPTGAMTGLEEASLFGFLEAQGAYTPGSEESFTVTVEALRI